MHPDLVKKIENMPSSGPSIGKVALEVQRSNHMTGTQLNCELTIFIHGGTFAWRELCAGVSSVASAWELAPC